MRWMERTMKGIFVGLIVCISVVFTTQTAHAGELPEGVVAVDQAATGTDDGTSWEDAYNDLQDALDFALNNPELVDQIWVAAAAEPYLPSERLDPTEPRSATFSLINGVGLYAGFLGNAPGGDETELSERDPENNITILSGEVAPPGP